MVQYWTYEFLFRIVSYINNIHIYVLSNHDIMQGDGNFAAVYKDSVTSAAGEASMELIGVLITAMIILVSAFE